MIVNILHRVTPGPLYPYFLLQQEYAHELGLKVTLMVQVDAMQNNEIVSAINYFADHYGDEIALSLSLGYGSPEFHERVGGHEEFLWLYSVEEKRAIIQLAVESFRRTFGHDPTSVASYHLDAISQQLLREICPSVKIAVAGCFEEGVKVFHGCNHSWYLFNEGMPWNPWYPSKDHALRPAQEESEWTGIIGVPHLSRDLALSYEGRNDFFASHPANAQRGMVNVGLEHPYDYNLCDLYRYQEDFNAGHSYYNVFVSPGWLAGHPTIQDSNAVSQQLYRDLLEYFVELRQQGALIDMSMREYAEWFRQHRPIGTAEIYLAKEVLYGSKKHYLWYIDAKMRILIDAHQGGSIGDLRPYVGKVPMATGADQEHLMIGSYPYLIQSIYRSGASHHFLDGARTTLLLSHNGESIDLCTCKTRVIKIERDTSGTHVTLSPAQISFSNGLELQLETQYRLHDGCIWITRRLLSTSNSSAEVEAREYFKGCYGVTEYPENMRGITLSVDGETPATIAYAYQRRVRYGARATRVSAHVPQVRTTVALEPISECLCCGFSEGFLFSPYYTLTADYALSTHMEITSCLMLSAAPSYAVPSVSPAKTM